MKATKISSNATALSRRLRIRCDLGAGACCFFRCIKVAQMCALIRNKTGATERQTPKPRKPQTLGTSSLVRRAQYAVKAIAVTTNGKRQDHKNKPSPRFRAFELGRQRLM